MSFAEFFPQLHTQQQAQQNHEERSIVTFIYHSKVNDSSNLHQIATRDWGLLALQRHLGHATNGLLRYGSELNRPGLQVLGPVSIYQTDSILVWSPRDLRPKAISSQVAYPQRHHPPHVSASQVQHTEPNWGIWKIMFLGTRLVPSRGPGTSFRNWAGASAAHQVLQGCRAEGQGRGNRRSLSAPFFAGVESHYVSIGMRLDPKGWWQLSETWICIVLKVDHFNFSPTPKQMVFPVILHEVCKTAFLPPHTPPALPSDLANRCKSTPLKLFRLASIFVSSSWRCVCRPECHRTAGAL